MHRLEGHGWRQALGKISRPYVKNNLKQKKLGAVVQVVQHKQEALGSSPSTSKWMNDWLTDRKKTGTVEKHTLWVCRQKKRSWIMAQVYSTKGFTNNSYSRQALCFTEDGLEGRSHPFPIWADWPSRAAGLSWLGTSTARMRTRLYSSSTPSE
jgi:hypothetical protein